MPRILLIEDDIQLQNMLCEMLKNAGYDVQQALNGSEGISCYQLIGIGHSAWGIE